MTTCSRRSVLGLLGVAGAGTLYQSMRPQIAYADSPAVILSVLDFGAKAEPGFNNTPAIQAAIDAAAVEAKRVFIPAGVYEVDLREQASLSLPSGVHLFGAGIKTILRLTAAPGQRAHMISNADWKGGNHSCVIEGLTLQCGGFGSYVDGNDYRVNGVTLFNARNCVVERVVVQNGQGYGIWLHDSSDSRVSDCIVEDLGDCLELSGNSERNLIEHNSIVSSGQVPWVGTGIILFGESRYNTIVSNSIQGGFGQGITTVSQYGCASHCIFSNNQVDVYNAPAIELEGDGHLLSGNRLHAHGRAALFFSERVSPARDVSVSGNSLESTGAQSLYISPACERLTFQSNRMVSRLSSAIFYSGYDHCLIGNHIEAVETDAPVLETGDGDQCMVQGNVFKGINGILNRHMKSISFNANAFQLKKRAYKGIRNSAFRKKRKK